MRWVARIDRPRRVLEQHSIPLPDAPALLQLAFEQLGTDGRFIGVGCSLPAWITFYASAAARAADAQRPITADPSPSAGVLLDLHFNAQVRWLLAPPGATYSNADTPLQARIWAAVRTEQLADQPADPAAAAATVTVLALVEHELASAQPAPPPLLSTP
jgi:hypothetical protein